MLGQNYLNFQEFQEESTSKMQRQLATIYAVERWKPERRRASGLTAFVASVFPSEQEFELIQLDCKRQPYLPYCTILESRVFHCTQKPLLQPRVSLIELLLALSPSTHVEGESKLAAVHISIWSTLT